MQALAQLYPDSLQRVNASIIAGVGACIYERHKLRNRKLHLLPFTRGLLRTAVRRMYVR